VSVEVIYWLQDSHNHQEVEMRWAEIREQYPNQWLIVDALEAHTEGDRRKLDQMTVVEVCPDGATALSHYQELHRQHPQREFYSARCFHML
jgi:hypothetical protein